MRVIWHDELVISLRRAANKFFRDNALDEIEEELRGILFREIDLEDYPSRQGSSVSGEIANAR